MSAGDHDPILTVVSRCFPPQVSGSAILMANLISGYTGKVRAIAGYSQYSQADKAFQPPCPTQYLFCQRILPRVYDALLRRIPAIIYRCIAASIQKALVKVNTNIVLAAFPFDDFLVASFVAARQLALPFYVHMHDLWIENKPAGTAAADFARQWEPTILKKATRVLCMTEAMQEHYETKYKIKTYLMPHTIAEQDLLNMPCGMRPPKLSNPSVLFVGSVSSHMNLDSLRVLAQASELLPNEYELIYCTSSDFRTLHRLGIQSNRLKAKYVSRAEVSQLQATAHVLIAPLSHKNCSRDEVRTVFSTKLLEYLVSGRPIVVFAPEDSYHAKAARDGGWAYVVTEDSAEALAAAIQRVMTDYSMAQQLIEGALQEARRRNAKYHARRLREFVVADAR